MQDAEPMVRLACRAMNTRFEVALWGRDETYLTAVAEEALREVRALEQQLSFYRDDSDVRELNVYAALAPVTVEPRLFALLQRAVELSRATGGAFDLTVAPLLSAWGFTGEGGRVPTGEELEAARTVTGMNLVELDPDASTVRFLREGVMIDLGAIGKGYAIERAAEILRDCEVAGALVHGGTSTVKAIGTQPDGAPWKVAIQDPMNADASLDTVSLDDTALSVSAVHGRFFTEGDARYGHVLDPRIGRPVQGSLLAAVVCPSATDSDALSTALLVLGEPFFPALREVHPGASALVVTMGDAGKVSVARLGT
ncbi:MAG TPA: FAD:protein FMN transferase [Armatimonadota bacterium]|nr:FAD:protein FMN transferase [Armatimonadota bacterium]